MVSSQLGLSENIDVERQAACLHEQDIVAVTACMESSTQPSPPPPSVFSQSVFTIKRSVTEDSDAYIIVTFQNATLVCWLAACSIPPLIPPVSTCLLVDPRFSLPSLRSSPSAMTSRSAATRVSWAPWTLCIHSCSRTTPCFRYEWVDHGGRMSAAASREVWDDKYG